MRLQAILFTAAALFAASTLAHASTVAFNSESTFTAATTGVTTYTFPAPARGHETIDVGSPYVDGPATFSTVVDGEYNLLQDNTYSPNGTYLEYASENRDTETITFTGDPTAVSFDIGDDGFSSTLTFDINGVLAGSLLTPSTATAGFIGFTSTAPITTVTLIGSDDFTVWDFTQFQVAEANTSPVPEPSSLSLLATGLLGAGTMLRRKLARS